METVIENKDMLDFDTLSSKMVKIANDLVGSVGKSTKAKYSITGENYVEFVYVTTNPNEILSIWENWIKGYISFSRFCLKWQIKYIKNPLYIYWRTKPMFRYKDNLIQVYVRLLISTISINNVAELKELCPDYFAEIEYILDNAQKDN